MHPTVPYGTASRLYLSVLFCFTSKDRPPSYAAPVSSVPQHLRRSPRQRTIQRMRQAAGACGGKIASPPGGDVKRLRCTSVRAASAGILAGRSHGALRLRVVQKGPLLVLFCLIPFAQLRALVLPRSSPSPLFSFPEAFFPAWFHHSPLCPFRSQALPIKGDKGMSA